MTAVERRLLPPIVHATPLVFSNQGFLGASKLEVLHKFSEIRGKTIQREAGTLRRNAEAVCTDETI